MRRPTFDRWIKRKAQSYSDYPRFSMRKLAALAQSDDPSIDSSHLTAALFLFARENDCLEQLTSLGWSDEAHANYEKFNEAIGERDIERLALRGTPLMSVPEEYRDILSDFSEAWHAPENGAKEKRELWKKTHDLQIRIGISNAAVARAVKLDPGNANAYLSKGDIDRVTTAKAREILEYVENLPIA